MKIETLKKLKAKEFPEYQSDDENGYFEILDGEEVYYPTLENLIDSCGSEFMSLKREPHQWIALQKDFPDGYANRDGLCGIGDSPTEAVAQLWLILDPPRVAKMLSGATKEESKKQDEAGYCPKHKAGWDVQSVGCSFCFDEVNQTRIDQLDAIVAVIKTRIMNNEHNTDINGDFFFETLKEIKNIVESLITGKQTE